MIINASTIIILTCPDHRLRSSQITLTGEMFWEDCDTTLCSECKLFLVFFCHFVFSPLSGFFFTKTKEIQLDDLFCTRSFQLAILSIYHLSIHHYNPAYCQSFECHIQQSLQLQYSKYKLKFEVNFRTFPAWNLKHVNRIIFHDVCILEILI